MILRRVFLVFLFLVSVTFAATPTSFCKCTCGSNSTIIPLIPYEPPNHSGSNSGSSSGSSSLLSRSLPFLSSLDPRADDDQDTKPGKTPQKKPKGGSSCNDCNRQFCLEYNLPFCKNTKDEEVFTTCFQRDSRKDEAIVFIFIIATGGLLIYAGIRPWVERWLEAAKERSRYIPVSAEEG